MIRLESEFSHFLIELPYLKEAIAVLCHTEGENRNT